jgi:hypothetical protein
MFDESDQALTLFLAGCTLAKKDGRNNWVEEEAVGGLPEYICRIARAIHRDGSKSVSQSIAIAVGRVKAWARGEGGVTAKTRTQAAKAVAQWEAKKKAAKLDNKVKLSGSGMLALTSYSIDSVRQQYMKTAKSPNEYRYIREMWNDHFIVAIEKDGPDLGEPLRFIRVDYSVDKSGNVSFGNEVEVKEAFVALSDTLLTDAQLELAALIPCTEKANRSLLETVRLSQQLRMEESELMKLSSSVRNLL